MIERGQDPSFPAEADQAVRISSELVGEDFERDLAAESRIAGPVDSPHSANAEQRLELIHTEAATNCHRRRSWARQLCGRDCRSGQEMLGGLRQ